MGPSPLALVQHRSELLYPLVLVINHRISDERRIDPRDSPAGQLLASRPVGLPHRQQLSERTDRTPARAVHQAGQLVEPPNHRGGDVVGPHCGAQGLDRHERPVKHIRGGCLHHP